MISGFQIEIFYLLSCPSSFTQELETRGDARILTETIDRNALTKTLPPIALDQILQNLLECLPIKGVIRMLLHILSIYSRPPNLSQAGWPPRARTVVRQARIAPFG